MFRLPVNGSVVLLTVAAAALGGCGNVETGDQLHTVGGQLRGMWTGAEGVALRLEADGVSSLLTVTKNGEVAFTPVLVAGASYSVPLVTSPPSHTCTVESGAAGVVSGADVTSVSVVCTGPTVA